MHERGSFCEGEGEGWEKVVVFCFVREMYCVCRWTFFLLFVTIVTCGVSAVVYCFGWCGEINAGEQEQAHDGRFDGVGKGKAWADYAVPLLSGVVGGVGAGAESEWSV